jgi:hypothetical protein
MVSPSFSQAVLHSNKNGMDTKEQRACRCHKPFAGCARQANAAENRHLRAEYSAAPAARHTASSRDSSRNHPACDLPLASLQAFSNNQGGNYESSIGS